MARREVTFLQENYYHIYNRVNNYQKIFLEAENYLFFLKRLHYYFDPNRIDVIAYCLMPNHYHVLIHLNTDIDVSNIMRSFTDSYVKSFNNWHRRVGHLFQGDFQAKQIDQDGYLPYLCAYIHLNPVKAKLVKSPDEWPILITKNGFYQIKRETPSK